MDFSINKTTYKPSFHSRNFPVNSFKIVTKKGELLVNELKLGVNVDSSLKGEIADFFNGNLYTDNPVMAFFVKLANRSRLKKDIERLISSDKGNSTILVARDCKNKIHAAIMTNEFQCINNIRDTKTCLLDALAVSLDYRKHKVGNLLMEKCMEPMQNAYTDIFVYAKNSAVPFYKKLGFESLETGVKNHDKVVDLFMQSNGGDYADYVTHMHKGIGSDINGWCNRILSKNKRKIITAEGNFN